MTTVAVLGTGIMGEPIARNLTKGFDVRVWNRTRDKAQRLAGDGATVCDTAREAATGAGRRQSASPPPSATAHQASGADERAVSPCEAAKGASTATPTKRCSSM